MDERKIHGEYSASVTFDIETLLEEKAKQETDDNPETSESRPTQVGATHSPSSMDKRQPKRTLVLYTPYLSHSNNL
jgi:hypothetical protein